MIRVALLTIALAATCPAALAQNADQQAALQVTAKLLDDGLKDFEGARLKEVYLDTYGLEVCGKVNAKNSYGAYEGWRRFQVDVDGRDIIFETGDEATRAVANGLRFIECKAMDRWKKPPIDFATKVRSAHKR